MSMWDLRQWIESRLPWWLPFAALIVCAALIWAQDYFVKKRMKERFKSINGGKR